MQASVDFKAGLKRFLSTTFTIQFPQKSGFTLDEPISVLEPSLSASLLSLNTHYKLVHPTQLTRLLKNFSSHFLVLKRLYIFLEWCRAHHIHPHQLSGFTMQFMSSD
jgi:hypothetical protein